MESRKLTKDDYELKSTTFLSYVDHHCENNNHRLI